MTKGGKPFLVANTIVLLMFVFSMIVQYNDPDPGTWLMVYGSATAACVLAFFRSDRWIFPAAVFLLATLWAAALSPNVLGRVPFLEMFGAWEMKDTGIEESREMYGLLIVAVWMAVLALRGRRQRTERRVPSIML